MGAFRELSETEKAILRYTDEETMNIRVKDETFTAVREILSEEGVVELTTAIGYYGMVCRILETLQVELEKKNKERSKHGFKLKRQSVLITGGSEGIGRACAEILAAEGCTLHLAARDKTALRKTKIHSN